MAYAQSSLATWLLVLTVATTSFPPVAVHAVVVEFDSDFVAFSVLELEAVVAVVAFGAVVAVAFGALVAVAFGAVVEAVVAVVAFGAVVAVVAFGAVVAVVAFGAVVEAVVAVVAVAFGALVAVVAFGAVGEAVVAVEFGVVVEVDGTTMALACEVASVVAET